MKLLLKQPLIRAQSTAGEPWRAVAQRVLGDALQDREQLVSSFEGSAHETEKIVR